MPEQLAQTTSQGGTQESGSALKSVAAAAIAAAVAGMIARKLSTDGETSAGSSGGRAQNGGSQGGRTANPMFGSIASGGLDAARDALVPAAEDAAGAMGAFVATNAPEIVRDRIVPRFIQSFNEARGG